LRAKRAGAAAQAQLEREAREASRLPVFVLRPLAPLTRARSQSVRVGSGKAIIARLAGMRGAPRGFLFLVLLLAAASAGVYLRAEALSRLQQAEASRRVVHAPPPGVAHARLAAPAAPPPHAGAAPPGAWRAVGCGRDRARARTHAARTDALPHAAVTHNNTRELELSYGAS
jgi:hypothetical protein